MRLEPENITGTLLQWETINCPVCGDDRFTLIFKKNNEPFVKCNQCGLLLINPRPVYEKVFNTYSKDYSDKYARKSKKKLRRCRRWVARTGKFNGIHGRWLDVGCSVGFVVKAAMDLGFNAYGADVEAWGIEFGKKNMNLKNLFTGTLEQQNFPDGFFSVISLYDVIEHVPDLNRLTAELKRLLARNGVIDIITPDLGHWRVPADLSTWNEIKPSEHLYYFSETTLSRLMQKHGLKIVKKRFHFKPSLRVYITHAD